MLAVVDYGLNNVRSVHNALRRLCIGSVVTSDPEVVMSAGGVILPGVGSFTEGVSALDALGLREVLKECLKRGVPLLGICLGMQMLFARSEERGTDGSARGLSLLAGQLVRFPRGVKVPHMGYNTVQSRGGSILMNGLDNPYLYFAHSYYLPCSSGVARAVTEYGGTSFASVVEEHPLYGTQFHPEKSGACGLRVLLNFARRMSEAA